jgi:hypothetical protein
VGGSGPGRPRWAAHEAEAGSRPISRVLSWATIHLGHTSPCASSDLPGSPCGQQERARKLARFPIWSCSRWGLPCRRMLPPARCALTAPFHPYLQAACRERHTAHIGGLLSVALSVGSRPPGVTWHLALWSPDFPRRRETPRLPGRLPARLYPARPPTPAPFACPVAARTRRAPCGCAPSPAPQAALPAKPAVRRAAPSGPLRFPLLEQFALQCRGRGAVHDDDDFTPGHV